jgi:Icc protein
MPLYLPQLTRRDFLKRTVCAGAATALAPRLVGAGTEKPRNPNTFALFSDPHIAADPTEQHFGVNMTHNLTACTRELADWPVRPFAIIVNGDLAYFRGKPEDYATFKNLIEPLREIGPVHLTLGNHDQRDHFWTAFPGEAAEQNLPLHRQAGIMASDFANWLLLDSLDETAHAAGKLGQAQLDWLGKVLDERPDKPAIVVLHHNPEFNEVVPTGLSDTRALMAVISSRRQVKMMIFGHTHDWHVSQHASGIHLVNLPPTAYVFIAGRPSGWVRATLARGGAQIELRALARKHPEHGQVHDLKWRDA